MPFLMQPSPFIWESCRSRRNHLQTRPQTSSVRWSGTVEDFLCGSSARNHTSQAAQPLQSWNPDFPFDEDHGESHLEPPLASGEPRTWAQHLVLSRGCHLSVCCTDPSLTWSKCGALWGSCFFYFSSVFNTIQPALLRGKLEGARVDEQLTAWTIDYLANIPQYVLRNGLQHRGATGHSSFNTVQQ